MKWYIFTNRILTIAGLFFGHFEKNSSSKKLKTQAKSLKNSSKIPKKLKNRQLHLSLVGGNFFKHHNFIVFYRGPAKACFQTSLNLKNSAEIRARSAEKFQEIIENMHDFTNVSTEV